MLSPCMNMIFVVLFVMTQAVAEGQVVDCTTNAAACDAYDGAVCNGNTGVCTCIAYIDYYLNYVTDCVTACSTDVPCQNGGQCDQNSGTCACSHGYRGYLCEKDDPTRTCGSKQVLCSPYASCYNTNHDQVCVCDSGYKGDGISCSGVDCGPTPHIQNGGIVLIDGSNTTFGATAVVLCNGGYISSVSMLTCLQTGFWDYIPVCTIIDCGSTINAVLNGIATPRHSTTYGSTAAVTCNVGYENPSQGIITCEQDGTWSSSACGIKDCGSNIGTVTNGVAETPLRTTFRSSIPVICDEGYENPAGERVICQADGNWSDLSCLIKDCGSTITTVVSGTARIDSATTFGSTASVTCIDGYINPDPTTLTCQANGTWSISSCFIKDCGSNIDSIVSGTALISDTTFGSTALVTCDEGFKNPSPTAIICQANGTWSNSTCFIKDCGSTITTVVSGTARIYSATTFRSTASVTCLDGYKNPDPTTLTCQANGTWSISVCTIKDCGSNIDSIVSGTALISDTTFGSTALVTCDEGFENPSPTAIICQANGTWSNSTCFIKDCGSTITTVVSGTARIYSATTFGSTASVTCLDGYENPDPTTLTCQANGTWSISVCTIKDCGSNIESVLSGSALISNTTFGSTASVICDKGFENPSPTEITCKANGTWSNSTCFIKDCGSTITTVVSGTAQIYSATTFGSTASVTCIDGYENPDPTTLTCQANGTWSISSCFIKDCGSNIDSIVSGTALISDTTFGSTALVTCDEGFENPSPTAIICQANGTWSNSTCFIKDCGSNITTVVSGTTRIDSATTFGSTASVTCIDGYENPDPPTLTCQANGTWSISICTIKDCGILQHPQNGAVSFSLNTQFNSTATYMCDDGHVIAETTNITSSSRLCLANGTWSGNATICVKREPTFILSQRRNITFDSNLNNPDSIEYKMLKAESESKIDKSFVNSSLAKIYVSSKVIAFSPGSVIIQTRLEFSAQQITVDNEVIELDARVVEDTLKDGVNDTNTDLDEVIVTESPNCGPLTQPNNGAITIDPDTYYGATAVYTCNQGYLIDQTAQISATRACTSAGSWSGTRFTCLRACDVPADIEHGEVSYTDRLPGSRATYTCDVGYELVGESLRTCQNDGMWTELPPVCQIRSCGVPESIPNGRFQAGNDTMYGDTVMYSCDDGFIMIGEPTLQCSDTGVWLGFPPSCQPSDVQVATCARIQSDAYNFTWAEQFVGNTSSQSCPDNSTGAVTKACNDEREWSETKIACVRKSIVRIQIKAFALNENSTSDEIADTLDELNNITEIAAVNGATVPELAQAELEELAGTLDYLADVIRPQALTEAITDIFLNVANNLIDEENTKAWENSNSGAELVLSAVDSFTDILTVQLALSDNTKIVISKENIVVEVRKVSSNTTFVFPYPSVEEDVLDDWVKQTRSSVVLKPENLLGNTSYITRASIYRDISRILSTTRTPQSLDAEDEEIKEINGPVMAFSTSPPVVRKLDPPVTLTFEHSKINLKEATCNFWVFAENNTRNVPGYWSSEGCSVVSSNDTITVCQCDHLTNFAVLMSPFQAADVNSIPLRIVSIVGISVSILGICITMFMHLCLWRYLRSNRVVIHMNLCIALLISYVTFIGGVDRIESKESCAFVAALLHYIYLVVFFTMLVEGIEIGSSVLFLFSRKSRVKPLLIMAWVLPGIIVAVSLGITKTKGYGNKDFCWLSIESGLIWAFVGPALAVIICNSVCLILVFRKLFTTKAMAQKTKGDKIKTSVRSLCVLMPLMGLTWIIGIFNITEGFYWIQYMFAICNGLQGFFIFIIHCVLNEHMKRALETRKRRRTATSMTSASVKKGGMPSKEADRVSRKNKEFSSSTSQNEEHDLSISFRKTIEDSGGQEFSSSSNRSYTGGLGRGFPLPHTKHKNAY